MRGFKNVKTYVYGKGIITCDIAVNGEKIVKIGNDLAIDNPFPYKDGQVVVAGFIDEHIHGANGADAMDGDKASLIKIANALVKEGTTSFLATTMTQSEENICKALHAVRDVMAEQKNGARVLGAHLEGPFISEKHIGAQPLKYLKDPDEKLFNEFVKESKNNVRLITLAPEELNAEKLILAAKKAGVTVSAGHTDAGIEQMEKAKNCGLSCVTHTYNAMRPLHHRQAGTVGAALIFDDLYTEVICDLIHVSAPSVKLLIKNKPKDKVVLITDSMRAKWLPDGESELGGQKVFVKNGEARLADGTLAGSVLKMNVAVKNLVMSCGVKFTDAIDYATVNPARNLGLKNTGEIKEGFFADFTVLDEKLNVCATVVRGNLEYFAD